MYVNVSKPALLVKQNMRGSAGALSGHACRGVAYLTVGLVSSLEGDRIVDAPGVKIQGSQGLLWVITSVLSDTTGNGPDIISHIDVIR